MYGPPSLMRTAQCWFFRICSSILSLCFLVTIVGGAIFSSIPWIVRDMRQRAFLRNPLKQRPFYAEEVKRAQERRKADKAWRKQERIQGSVTPRIEKGTDQSAQYIPTEGGTDRLCTDIAYYARRVGLDAESIEVQTEDGFIIELWHIFDPGEYRPRCRAHRKMDGPEVFEQQFQSQPFPAGSKKYPILMMHGLLQSAGAYCCNDDDSMAFYLAKSGYDVWLGNNRCGFEPKHTLLTYEDPRMWAWNIRQMGVMDLPALISRVLAETGFPKLALIAHSQGTTQTFVALAKEQRPEIGEKISVFCALAPAVYAGPLIGKVYLKAMSVISPAVFRLIFGIHSFIPVMMLAHKLLPAKTYSWMGYHVFSFLFSWSDTRWDRGLRNRMFQQAPTYVSAESMRWWLGRECFAKHKCILATREEGKLEDKEDEEDDHVIQRLYVDREPHVTERRKLQRNLSSFHCATPTHSHRNATRGRFSWYNDQFPPLALWVCGADNLVDGRRLLRRFDRGREPHVRIVHKKIIEGYEHLDVIWAMDAVEKVGKEVREVIWRTVDPESAKLCRTPVGCTKPLEQEPDQLDVPLLNSGGRLRMASINETRPPQLDIGKTRGGNGPETQLDASEEKLGEHDEQKADSREYGFDQWSNSDMEAFPKFDDIEEKSNPLG
nr:sterol esterase 2 [Quercus suber]